MKISNLQASNFRCFDNVNIDFDSKFNIFVGDNASGKTALLEAIAVALSDWVSAFSESAMRQIQKNDVRKVSRWSRGEFISKPQYPVQIQISGSVFKTDYTWSHIWNERDIKKSNQGMSGLLFHDVQGKDDLSMPVLVSYKTDRLIEEQWATQQPKAFLDQADMSRMDGYRDALTGGRISPQALILWLEYQDWTAYKQRRESPLYIAVREAMTAMIPLAKSTQYDPRSGQPITVFEDGALHPFSELSEGQRCMVALAGDIAIRMARLNPQLGEKVLLETPGVILIDELDLHLHPKWQREIANRLRRTFPMVQFITTTHSPQILSEVEPDCISVINRDERGQIQITKPVQSYGLDANTILENLMGSDSRPDSVRERIDAVDEALEEGEWEKARGLVDELRKLLHGDDPETARLDASTYALEALADAVD